MKITTRLIVISWSLALS